jgi:pyruvate/2-oxoglutarate/acetoin dehydrogenase E1 component
VGLYGGALQGHGRLSREVRQGIGSSTPISEEGYTGVAIGAAFNGLRPIVEFQFIDFIANAFNMITNFAAKSRYRWGAECPS